MADTPAPIVVNTEGEGLRIDEHEVESIVVNTENSTYEITILHRETGDVQLVGGRHFPEKTRMKLLGASVGGSLLKVHAIFVGLNLEFLHNGRRIITSPVCSITWRVPECCETKPPATPLPRAS
jgi:hypothetical protein